MTDKMHQLEAVRKAAELTIVEFTEILPIQRSTYYGWLKSLHTPDPFRIEVCLDYADLVNDCVSEGLLPIKGRKRGFRLDEIRSALKKLT